MSDNPSSPAAGWYPNPEGEGLRWWDGSGWTEHTHVEVAAAAEPEATPEPVATPTPDPAPAGGSAPPPGVVPPSGLPTSSAATPSPTAATGGSGPMRIFGVRPWVWLALILIAAAALLLPFVIFDEEEIPPPDDPVREGPGKKSGASGGDGPSITLLAARDAGGAWVIASS